MSKPRLAPCPFCRSADCRAYEGATVSYVVCDDCLCFGPDGTPEQDTATARTLAAIAAWNTRPTRKARP